MYDLTILDVHLPHIWFPTAAQGVYLYSRGGQAYAPNKTYRDENLTTFNAIARRGTFARGTKDLCLHYAVRQHEKITKASIEADDLIKAVADWIVANLV